MSLLHRLTVTYIIDKIKIFLGKMTAGRLPTNRFELVGVIFRASRPTDVPAGLLTRGLRNPFERQALWYQVSSQWICFNASTSSYKINIQRI